MNPEVKAPPTFDGLTTRSVEVGRAAARRLDTAKHPKAKLAVERDWGGDHGVNPGMTKRATNSRLAHPTVCERIFRDDKLSRRVVRMLGLSIKFGDRL